MVGVPSRFPLNTNKKGVLQKPHTPRLGSMNIFEGALSVGLCRTPPLPGRCIVQLLLHLRHGILGLGGIGIAHDVSSFQRQLSLATAFKQPVAHVLCSGLFMLP